MNVGVGVARNFVWLKRMMLCVLSGCEEGDRLGGRGPRFEWVGVESWASLSAQLSPPLLCLFCTMINTPFRCHVVIFT